jgi:hypothetical protein
MLRIGEICRRFGCQKSALYANYIRIGRLPMYPLGVRTVGALESDVERLVGEMVAKGPVDYASPLHARRLVGRPASVGKRCDEAEAIATPLSASWLWVKRKV